MRKMSKKDLIKKNKELNEYICYLKSKIEELEKTINGDFVISDHCCHCKHGIITENFYSSIEKSLITCELHPRCLKFEKR